MRDVPDYELLKSEDEATPRMSPRRSAGLWIAAIALLAGAAVATYVIFSRQTSAPASVSSERLEAPAQHDRQLGGDGRAISLPPLDESDSFVRDLVKAMSSNPGVVTWLATDGLIRNFTLGVANVADGKSPAGQLRRLRPSSKFGVLERGGDLQIDPRSYARYDALAALRRRTASSVRPMSPSIEYSKMRSCCCSARPCLAIRSVLSQEVSGTASPQTTSRR